MGDSGAASEELASGAADQNDASLKRDAYRSGRGGSRGGKSSDGKGRRGKNGDYAQNSWPSSNFTGSASSAAGKGRVGVDNGERGMKGGHYGGGKGGENHTGRGKGRIGVDNGERGMKGGHYGGGKGVDNHTGRGKGVGNGASAGRYGARGSPQMGPRGNHYYGGYNSGAAGGSYAQQYHYGEDAYEDEADESGNGLKNLLAQVAPQANITENSSQLTSRASAKILGKMMSDSSGGFSASSSAMAGNMPYPHGGGYIPEYYENYDGYGAGAYYGYNQRASRESERTASQQWLIDGMGDDFDGPARYNLGEDMFGPMQPLVQDDDDDTFLEKWTGLFSKGSPLVEGTATDPFKEDLRRRAKVVWKKNRDRPGHHSRYQKRRQQREGPGQDDEEEVDTTWTPKPREEREKEEEDDEEDEEEEEAEADVKADASENPANEANELGLQ